MSDYPMTNSRWVCHSSNILPSSLIHAWKQQVSDNAMFSGKQVDTSHCNIICVQQFVSATALYLGHVAYTFYFIVISLWVTQSLFPPGYLNMFVFHKQQKVSHRITFYVTCFTHECREWVVAISLWMQHLDMSWTGSEWTFVFLCAMFFYSFTTITDCKIKCSDFLHLFWQLFLIFLPSLGRQWLYMR